MSGKNTTVSLTLQIKGQQASAEMKRFTDQQVQGTQKINQAWTQIGSAQARFVNTAKAGTQATMNTARAGDHLLRTNRMLEGVLRQQSIQTKLQSQALKQQVSSTQQMAVWMKQIEQASKRTHQHTQQTSSLLQKGAAVGGALIGAGYALQQPIKRTVDYDRDLHYASQKLSDSPNDWKNSKKWLNTIVIGNAVNGGVDRDQSFLAMDALIANGAYTDKNLDKMKSNLAKAHFEASKSALASGGDILDFAQVGVAAKSRNLNESKVQAMVIKADDLGAMGAKDVAKALPSQLGKLAVDKVNSERAIAQLIALNEISMKTAGNAAEADTNVNNYLGKMYSNDTNERLQKKYNIDLPSRYAAGKDKGLTDFDVFSNVADEILAKDKKMQVLAIQMAKAKNDQDAMKILETKKAIFEQSSLAAILPDMQSLMTFVATKRYGKEWETMTQTAMSEGEKTRDLKYNFNKQELASYGINAFDVTRKNAEYQTLQGTIGALGDMGVKVAEVVGQYDPLLKAMGAADIALTALAFSAGGAAIGGVISGGGKGGGSPVSGTTSKGSGLMKSVGIAAALYTGWEVFKPLDDTLYSKISGLFGGDEKRPDFVQDAINQSKEQQSKENGELLAQQQVANKFLGDMVTKLNSLINVTSENKPLPFNFPSGGLLGDISRNAADEEKRHGAALLTYKPN